VDNEQQKKYLEEAKTKFLAGMSNAIQRSMKNILKCRDLLKGTSLDPEQTQYIDSIYTDAHKLSWVVNDILDFCRLDIGKVELQSVNFNIEYLINDIFRKAVDQKKDHPVDTYIDIAKDVPRELVGDPTRLRQVLSNLLSNAFKYTQQGEIGIIVHCLSRANPAPGEEISLRISVKDSGKGIPHGQQDAIFEFHGREDPASSWEYGGTGLGLSICKLIIETMGGTITVDSAQGKGCEFIMTVPFRSGQSLREKGIYPLSRKELIGKKAVIVDDNEIARKILNKCCETLGMDVVLISSSPREVLQLLDDSLINGDTPDLILCDLMMPEMDGYNLARTIRANDGFCGVKLIAVTSAVRVGGAHSAQVCGFNGFLPKPVFLDELAKVIAMVLATQQEDGPIVTRHMVEEMEVKDAKILVIMGADAGQKNISESLLSLDCEADFVSNGQAALGFLREKIYNMCLMDQDIFQEEGTQIVQVIKEVSRNVPVIVILPKDTPEQRSKCLDAGVDDFIAKPVDLMNLKRLISRYSGD
jgi:CheY-like chemotaxis protein/anti-sigma regulatory factor (Ser/Thr protein kinase)